MARNAEATEEDKPEPNLAELANNGTNTHLTSIKTHHKIDQELALSATTAETQKWGKLSGATPLTRRRDGSTVHQNLPGDHEEEEVSRG